MRLELLEANQSEAKLPDGQKVIGGKADHILLRLHDGKLDGSTIFEVIEFDDRGSEHLVVSNQPDASGPPFEVRLLQSSDVTSDFLLRLHYVDLPGHKIRCRVGDAAAELLVWYHAPFEIVRLESDQSSEEWYVVNRAKTEKTIHDLLNDQQEVTDCCDAYGLGAWRWFSGPFHSRSEAERTMLLHVTDELVDALLTGQSVEIEYARKRAMDAALATRSAVGQR